MDLSNFTNSSGVMSNLIKLLPNGLNSQFPSLSDPQATPATPTTNVDNSSPAIIIALTATAIGTLSIVVCGARFLYNRMNSRRANGDDIQVAEVLQFQRRQQEVQGIEMSIQPRTNVPARNALSSVVSVSADLASGTNVNNQMPLPQFPFSPITDANPSISPSPLPQSPSPPSQSQSQSRG